MKFRKHTAAHILAGLVFLVTSPVFAQKPGKLTPKVDCKSDSSQSYSVYLPSKYTKKRSWPVLFGFSPGANGKQICELHQDAAERFGWIVVGSNNSRNGSMDVIERAAAAMWKDVRSRFKVDDSRLYSCGLSGGAAVANWFASQSEVPFAGVFMHARGEISGVPKKKSKTFYILLPGIVNDFNFGESVRFLCLAQRTGSTVHLESQAGGHTWASKKSCLGMLRYAELRAQLSPSKKPDRNLSKLIEEEETELTKRLDGPTFLCAWDRLEELDTLVHKQHKFKTRFKKLSKKHQARLKIERAAWKKLDKDCLFDAKVNDRYPSIKSIQAVDEARRKLYASHPGTTATHLALVSQVLAPISLQRVASNPPAKDVQDAYYAYAGKVKEVKTDFVAEAKKHIAKKRLDMAVVCLFHGHALGTVSKKTLKKSAIKKLSKKAGYKRLLEIAKKN